jgi:hypothetical protein
MSKITLVSPASGTAEFSITTPSGTSTDRTLTLPDAGGTVATLGTSLTLATAVASTSGTSINFTGIPSWVKRITVMFSGVSTNGSSNILVQLGASSVTTSGYLGGANSGGTQVNYTNGFGVRLSDTATAVVHGSVALTLVSGNSWVAAGVLSRSDAAAVGTTSGSIALGGTLDRVRITTVNGTDTFDAGTINIMYEG